MDISQKPPTDSDLPGKQNGCPGPANRTLGVFLISVLGLFLEMLLIRWIGTEIRIFAYLQNTVLVVCFLGLGLGCFSSRQPVVMRDMLLPLFVLVVLFAIPLTRNALGNTSELFSVLNDLVIWDPLRTSSSAQAVFFIILGLGIAYFLMILILNIFVPIGRLMGRLMDEHPNIIRAYSVNIAGSLIGTWLFVLLSVLYQPPLMWFMVVGGLTLFFVCRGSDRYLNYALLTGIMICSVFAGREPGSVEVIWSPYQKLVLDKPDKQNMDIGAYLVKVNNTGYQAMISSTKPRSPSDSNTSGMHGLSQYDIPLLLHPDPQKVLIVGAGTGNDAAGALRHGAKEITAVEIDPAIIHLGRRYHPEQPYSSQAIKLVNDDARSFFATSRERYDVIVFGLLDSHTTTAMTNARLDHYVYTKESIIRAKSLLADHGLMILSFEVQTQFIADRMRRLLREAFNEEPLYFRIPKSQYGWGGMLFVAGDLATAKEQITSNPGLTSVISKWQRQFPINLPNDTRITTDDWPYLYLKSPSVPLLYYLLACLLVLIFLRCRKQLPISELVSTWERSNWHFFFLGAAFLLLEVQNISKASVVLGNTWQVNAVIISGVLTMILLANLLARRFARIPLKLVYICLVGTCLALYFVDLSQFAVLSYASKVLIVGGLTTLPMFFSGIIFIHSFALAARKDHALGANLIGALIGAQLQSITFITGIKALLLMVVGIYLLSLFTIPRQVEQSDL